MNKIINDWDFVATFLKDCKDEVVDVICDADGSIEAFAVICIISAALMAVFAAASLFVMLLLMKPIIFAGIAGVFAISSVAFAYVRIKHGKSVFR